MKRPLVHVVFLCCLAAGSAFGAEGDGIDADVPEKTDGNRLDLVAYPADFFDRFQPVTALDMVRQVPGFRLDDDVGDTRGFATAAGNVLVDDRRPSTKRDTLTNILGRIPASAVLRIELIRGQVRNIDLRGQAEIVNLVLREGIPAVGRWELAARQTFGHGPLAPVGAISVTDNWNGVDVTVGLRARRNSVGRSGTEDIFDSSGNLVEARDDERGNRNQFYTASLNASSWWGETFWQVNSSYNLTKRNVFTDSVRELVTDDTSELVVFDTNRDTPEYELGIDIERDIGPGLVAKGILLGIVANQDFIETQADFDALGNQTLDRVAAGTLDATEVIARAEFDLSRFERHLLQANIERAYNVLDSSLVQTDDTGAGPVPIDIPGANSRVEEVRWDMLIKDLWSVGKVELEYGLGAEASTIRQTGDAELERDFFFIKPQFTMSYASGNSDQTRLRLAREVAQLNLENFVSATEFLDDDLALGNPNIEPDSTWMLELSREKRLRADAVVEVAVFHDWISDVLDLLPLSEDFEAPGNIGDGRRWGIRWESTLPLDALGLDNAKLDVKLRWQDSRVTDPVTGNDRVLSVGTISGGPIVFDVENEYAYEVDFRQDFEAARAAWGVSVWERGKQLQFKVNELETYDEGTEFRLFVETTRWGRVKVRVDAENLLDFADVRERRIFAGLRDLAPVASRYYRDRTRGRRLQVGLSGSF